MDIRHLLNEPIKQHKYLDCKWPECKKWFHRRSDLSRHFRTHTGDKPFHCKWPTCEKQFIQRSALTVHYRTHTGEKPHVCKYDHCGKSFNDSSSLTRHKRTHTGKRPYACIFTGCDKSFTRKTTLLRHQRCHDASWQSLSSNFQYMFTLVPNALNKEEMTSSVTKGSYSLSSPTRNGFNESEENNFSQHAAMTNDVLAQNMPLSTYYHCQSTTKASDTYHHFVLENCSSTYQQIVIL